MNITANSLDPSTLESVIWLRALNATATLWYFCKACLNTLIVRFAQWLNSHDWVVACNPGLLSPGYSGAGRQQGRS